MRARMRWPRLDQAGNNIVDKYTYTPQSDLPVSASAIAMTDEHARMIERERRKSERHQRAARLFGEFKTVTDNGYSVSGYEWCGEFFVTEIVKCEPTTEN